MKHKTPFCALVALACLPATGAAQFFDARSNAMGGTGVASSQYLSAGFANPALLARAGAGDHVGFVLPIAGFMLSDPDNLLDDAKDFADQVDVVQAKIDAATATPADLIDLNNRLNALNGRQAYAAGGVGFAVALPFEGLAVSVHAHNYLDFTARILVDPADTDPSTGRIVQGITNGTVENLGSEARLLAANVTELGVSVAKEFNLAGMSLAIGATPKAQRIDTFNYSVNAQNFEDNDFDSSQYQSDNTTFNLDLGVAFSPIEALTVGLMARNVLDKNSSTVTTFGQSFLYEIKPALILGAALKAGTMTFAADVDVTGDDRFRNVTLNFNNVLDDDSQLLRLGAEFDAWKWAQLRAGFVTDLKDTIEDTFTAGIGISPLDTFHLDIAGMYADEHSFGAVLQLSLTF